MTTFPDPPNVRPAVGPAAAGAVASRWRQVLADMFAGSFTAVVFYAEYIGLGVVLGSALPVPAGVALGSTMVVGAVLLNCVLGAAVRQPLLSGPRAASLAVLVAGMKFSMDHAAIGTDRLPVAMAALMVMLTAAAAVQLAGTLPRVRAWLACTSVALRKGFVFSTAVGIVVGLGSAQLDGCLRVSPALTLLVMICGVSAALVWSHWCNRPGGGPRRSSLAPFALIIGTVLAAAGYHILIARFALDGLCGMVDPTGLRGTLLPQMGVSLAMLQAAARSLPLWIWPALVLLGSLLGLVLLMESLTALRESRDRTPPAMWATHLKLRALANLAAAPLGLACSSVAMVRTNALIESSGRSRLAVLFHGLALLAILLFLQHWISMLPQLAVAVALLLLAIQMIDEETRVDAWRVGFQANAAPANVRSTWAFWGVVAFSLALGTVLHYQGWGFGGGPMIALLSGVLWTGVRFLRRRRELRRSRLFRA